MVLRAGMSSFDISAARDLLETLSSLKRTGDTEKELLAFRKQVIAAL
jgi:hypothetical protein